MDNQYFTEGYNLMNNYISEHKIKTRERNFRRRLDNWYNKNKDKDMLSIEEEQKYLKLEQYFYNNILTPETREEKALVNTLNLLANLDMKNTNNKK